MALWGGLSNRRDQNTALVGIAVLAVSVIVYAVSFLLTACCRGTANSVPTGPVRC